MQTTIGQSVRFANKTASSPASLGSESDVTHIGLRCFLPPTPRLTIPTLRPLSFKKFASQIVKGVLPVPPAVILPITITGTLKLCVFKKLVRYRKRLNET